MTFTDEVVFFSLSEWFLVPVVGFMKDLVHGQEAKPPGQSWQPPEGLAVSTLSAAG